MSTISDLLPKSEKAEPLSADPHAYRKLPLWHRGENVNYHPDQSDFFSETFLQDFVLKGWKPEKPVLTRGTKITAFGSCFAAHITAHLHGLGYNLSKARDPDIYISQLGDGMVSTASILGQFEWALENKKQAEDLWHGYKAEGYGYDEGIRARTRDVFLATEFFIITLGLSEVWYDEATGGTFWRAVPESVFDPRRHKFKVMTVEQTKADIARIHALIREHVPNARMLFTLSPIPLAATFRPVSCLSANAVSKAIIRAALDEFLRANEDELNKRLFYFPSMEIVQHCFVDAMGLDARHPVSYVLDTVMKAFEATYCANESTLVEANEMLQAFRAVNINALAKRKPSDGDTRKRLQAARAAKAAGMVARSKLKAQNAQLDLARAKRVGRSGEPSGVSGDSDRERRKAERKAKRKHLRRKRRQTDDMT